MWDYRMASSSWVRRTRVRQQSPFVMCYNSLMQTRRNSRHLARVAGFFEQHLNETYEESGVRSQESEDFLTSDS